MPDGTHSFLEHEFFELSNVGERMPFYHHGRLQGLQVQEAPSHQPLKT